MKLLTMDLYIILIHVFTHRPRSPLKELLQHIMIDESIASSSSNILFIFSIIFISIFVYYMDSSPH
jgi:hypothetical protein